MLNRLLATCCLLSTIAFSAWAVEQPLTDQEQEARAYKLFHEIRCSTCSGQTIAESPADAAADLRQAIRVQVAAGETDTAIQEYLVMRYGDSIMLYSPLTMNTAILWLGPALLLITVIIGVWIGIKKVLAQYNKDAL